MNSNDYFTLHVPVITFLFMSAAIEGSKSLEERNVCLFRNSFKVFLIIFYTCGLIKLSFHNNSRR